VMLVSYNDLAISSTPNVTEEMKRLSKYPSIDGGTTHGLDVKSYVGVRSEDHSDDNLKKTSLFYTYIWWGSVVFEGKLRDINAAISYLTYKGDNNWNSDAAGEEEVVNITVMDLGNTSHAYTVTKLISVYVSEVLDKPIITVVRLSNELLVPSGEGKYRR
jgi:hypothetical protein